MREEIRRYLNAIKVECETHIGKTSWCDGCSLRMADEGCFLGMNPKLPCNWDLGADLGVNLVDNLGKTKEVTTMAKNLIPEVCKLLGVEVGEKFKVKGCQYKNRPFYIHENGNVVIVPDENGYYCCHDVDLIGLLTGAQEIVKLPWKPTKYEKYFCFVIDYGSGKMYVYIRIWCNSIFDNACYKAGWVYRTKKEAEAALPKVAEELGVEYEL